VANAAGEQRPKLFPRLHGLYVKPLSTSRLLHWHVIWDSYPNVIFSC